MVRENFGNCLAQIAQNTRKFIYQLKKNETCSLQTAKKGAMFFTMIGENCLPQMIQNALRIIHI